MILGCTHYPIFARAIQETLGESGTLIDSARQTALVVEQQLDGMRARATTPPHAPGRGMGGGARLNCYVTDQGQRFERLAARFLGESVGQPVWVTSEMLELAEAS